MINSTQFTERRGKKFPPYLREAFRIISRQKNCIHSSELFNLLSKKDIQDLPASVELLSAELDQIPTLFRVNESWYTVSQFIIIARTLPQAVSKTILKQIMAKQLANKRDDEAA